MLTYAKITIMEVTCHWPISPVALLVMPRLQAVVRVCDLAMSDWWNFIQGEGEKSCGNGAIILRLTCGIGDFCLYLPVSGHTTACKRGIIGHLKASILLSCTFDCTSMTLLTGWCRH